MADPELHAAPTDRGASIQPVVFQGSGGPCCSHWLSEVDITGFGIAQAHLLTTISVDRVVEATGTNIGPVALQQIREIIADLLGLPGA